MGFRVNRHDECVFNRDFNGKQLTVCVYVDDLLCSCADSSALKWFESELKKHVKKITVKDGADFEFLSLEISQKDGGIDVSMSKYVRSLLEEWGGTEKSASPAEPDFMKDDESSVKLGAAEKEIFHRRVARLLFLAKRIAPDILLAVSVLAGHVKEPTLQDWDRLDRVYRYLNGSKDRVLQFWRGGKVEVSLFVDAAFACHADMKSRTGAVLLCCGCFVAAWTSKQTQNTKSSTESELVGLTDECGWLIWARNWMLEQGYPPMVPVIYQDNTSVVDILKRGPSAQLRTRHLGIRHHFVGDLIKRDEVKIEYCRTEDMVADMLTKPLIGQQFRKLRDVLVRVN
jgi:hypothetical protein